MQAIFQLLSRLRTFGRRRNLNRQIADEINFHIDEQTAAYIKSGMLVSLLASRALEGVLYEVRPLDSEVYSSVMLALTIAAAAGVFVPARRAVSVDPLRVLRHD